MLVVGCCTATHIVYENLLEVEAAAVPPSIVDPELRTGYHFQPPKNWINAGHACWQLAAAHCSAAGRVNAHAPNAQPAAPVSSSRPPAPTAPPPTSAISYFPHHRLHTVTNLVPLPHRSRHPSAAPSPPGPPSGQPPPPNSFYVRREESP
ncbi:hypothetical protein HU200_053055 [Digitaria exilis]|uniref:Uncharacterized protein n=1 Tax=Digitaria exilis TaxID=1010633 RepID=A0A835AXZ3_9POAL|nr:hypothetical protein HU200_053055 [Digitaria exilis]